MLLQTLSLTETFKCEGNRRLIQLGNLWGSRWQSHPPKEDKAVAGAYSGQWIHLPTGQRLNTRARSWWAEGRECCRLVPGSALRPAASSRRLKALFLLRLLGVSYHSLAHPQTFTQTSPLPRRNSLKCHLLSTLFRHSLSPCPIPILPKSPASPFY